MSKKKEKRRVGDKSILLAYFKKKNSIKMHTNAQKYKKVEKPQRTNTEPFPAMTAKHGKHWLFPVEN